MCGICGFYFLDGTQAETSTIKDMTSAMIPRGPDGDGSFVDGGFGMGMRRLAIIDLATGWQPLGNEDGTVQVVLNGEIYNYLELREELERNGHTFRTHSDVEVLAHLYEEKGLAAIDDLNGMFAFCLWDARLQRAWIGRDRFGIKPLVWRRDHRGVSFGSTLDALRAQGGWRPELDEDALLLLLGLAYVPAPRTIYRGVYKLLPGHWMTVDRHGEVTVQRYWTPERTVADMSEGELDAGLMELFRHSTLLHARSDVPVGCYLSGGLDSSFVTALFCLLQGNDVHTLNVDFEGKEFSEASLAAEVGQRYHTRHSAYLLRQADSWDIFGEIAAQLDEPLGDSAIIPSYFLSRAARQDGLRVMLSGAGGDEIFGGYARFFPARRESLARLAGLLPRMVWDRMTRIAPEIAAKGYLAHHRGIRLGLGSSSVSLGVLYGLLRDADVFFRLVELLEDATANAFDLRRRHGDVRGAMLFDCHGYLPDNVLAVQDKTSMAASVEARVPLLDHRIAELVFSAPEALVVPRTMADSKKVLRRLAAPFVPESILNRPKTGFNAPVHEWMPPARRDALLADLRHSPILAACGLFRTDALPAVLGADGSASATETLLLLNVLHHWGAGRA